MAILKHVLAVALACAHSAVAINPDAGHGPTDLDGLDGQAPPNDEPEVFLPPRYSKAIPTETTGVSVPTTASEAAEELSSSLEATHNDDSNVSLPPRDSTLTPTWTTRVSVPTTANEAVKNVDASEDELLSEEEFFKVHESLLGINGDGPDRVPVESESSTSVTATPVVAEATSTTKPAVEPPASAEDKGDDGNKG
ncbi:hypothetical protein CDD80_3025 [Ophiocordyceps camponoti-rufipedis]|uniref:Uncharacterized protein n=1 Tax=Ophiocordyceps camponoti-rufipedis TaxID=2004952 RepID=A0A2C5ZJ70_9HYPO|nr:hypothetical protein CDD80_3025 [Ophiocordyceps camponoti-rufipedis]